MKNKIATVLKITKTKIKQSYELRKFHTSRGENEQLQKTSGAYVLSSRKKNQKSLMGGGWGGGWQPPPLYIRGLKRVTKINHCRKGQDEPSHATPCLLGICRWYVRTTNLLVGSNTISRSMICAGCRPVAGGGAGGARAPPEIFRLELNSATKVEFFD